MTHFNNGVRYDYTTGDVKIYMTKPKSIEKSLKDRVITIDGTKLTIDEFKNKSGVTMLSFNGKLIRRFGDFISMTIYLRCRITNEVRQYEEKYGQR